MWHTMDKCWMETEEYFQGLQVTSQACWDTLHNSHSSGGPKTMYDDGNCGTMTAAEEEAVTDWWQVCQKHCEDMQPTHQDRMEKINQCKEAKCQNEDADLTLWGWNDCVYKSASFDSSKVNTCLADCQGEGGPNPAVPQRCYATMSPAAADFGEQVCWQKLPGQGWFDCRINWESPSKQNWDWGQGHPPCDYCVIKNFEADPVTLKPYVPPPRFGTSRCLPKCEEEIDQNAQEQRALLGVGPRE
jgi:hypothetical protein